MARTKAQSRLGLGFAFAQGSNRAQTGDDLAFSLPLYEGVSRLNGLSTGLRRRFEFRDQ